MSLVGDARFAALAVSDPETQMPFVSRIAFYRTEAGDLVSLVSGLALHTHALRANPACALLVGEPLDKGDPLMHPRMTIQASAEFIPRDSAAHTEMAVQYLHGHPKARLYLSLGDFGFVMFRPCRAFLNGGFGRAFELTPQDLGRRPV